MKKYLPSGKLIEEEEEVQKVEKNPLYGIGTDEVTFEEWGRAERWTTRENIQERYRNEIGNRYYVAHDPVEGTVDVEVDNRVNPHHVRETHIEARVQGTFDVDIEQVRRLQRDGAFTARPLTPDEMDDDLRGVIANDAQRDAFRDLNRALDYPEPTAEEERRIPTPPTDIQDYIDQMRTGPTQFDAPAGWTQEQRDTVIREARMVPVQMEDLPDYTNVTRCPRRVEYNADGSVAEIVHGNYADPQPVPMQYRDGLTPVNPEPLVERIATIDEMVEQIGTMWGVNDVNTDGNETVQE